MDLSHYSPKIHNHIGASHLKSEQFHGTSLFHCAWLHRNHHIKRKKKTFCLKPWCINKAYDVKSFWILCFDSRQSTQTHWNIQKIIICFLKRFISCISPVTRWIRCRGLSKWHIMFWKNSLIMDIGKMKQYYLLYIHDILEVCPLISKLGRNFIYSSASLLSLQIYKSAPTYKQQHFWHGKQRINDQTITVRTETFTVRYIWESCVNMVKIEKNMMGGGGDAEMEIKTIFFICMRDYERYMYKLVYSQPQLYLLWCPQMLRCP